MNRMMIPIFDPLEWQKAPFRDKSPILLLTGSAGGGKSRLAAEKLHAFCLKYPGATALMMRKASEWNSKSIIPFMQQSVIGDDTGVKKANSTFHYRNGSTLYTGGMFGIKQMESIRSIGGDGGLDIVWMEEGTAFTRDDLDEIKARMRGKAGSFRQIIITTNPDSAKHFINQELIIGGEASVYYSRATDNTHNPDDYINSLNSLKGVRGLRLRDGLWTQAEGAIFNYTMIDDIPEEVRNRARVAYGIDFGYSGDPAVVLRIYFYNEEFYLEEVAYGTGLSNQRLYEISKENGHQYHETTIADNEDPKSIAELQSLGMRCIRGCECKPHKDYYIKTIQQHTIYITKASANVCDDFDNYVWKKDSNGATLDVPDHKSSHSPDAFRYGSEAFFEKPKIPGIGVV